MSQTRQLCTFLLDDLLFGIEVTHVQEVIRYQEMTVVPLASSVVRAVMASPAWPKNAGCVASKTTLPCATRAATLPSAHGTSALTVVSLAAFGRLSL